MSTPSKRSSPPSARAGARSAAPASTCRSRIRRPARRSRRESTVRSTPSTACTHALARRTATSFGSGKCFVRSRSSSSGSPRVAGRRRASDVSARGAVRPRASRGDRRRRRRAATRLRDPAARARARRRPPAAPDARRTRRCGTGSAARSGSPRASRSGSGGVPSIVDQPLLARRVAVEPRHRVEQRPGVGMLRVGQQRLGRPLLDHLAGVHHDDARADVGDDAEVVADQHDRRAEIGVQLAQQVEDLRLDRDVERRGRLVGDQQHAARWRSPSPASRAGACRRRTGAGSESTARSGAVMPMRPSRSIARAQRRLRRSKRPCIDHRLDQLLGDPPHRVERRHRVLEDHRDRRRRAACAARSPSSVTMSRPRKTILPPTIRPGSSSRRMID